MPDDKKAKKPEKEKKKAKDTKVSPKLDSLIKEIEKLSVIELADLVKALEDKFGVSAAPMAAAAPAGAPATESGADAAGEAQAGGKASMTVVLTAAGEKKINVIKAVREINRELGLKEAKDLVEAAPKEILKDADKETAEQAKKKLEAAGGTVELK